MVSLSGGGAQPNISQNIIRKFKIPIPSLEIQKQMVEEMEKEEKISAANTQLITLMERKIEDILKSF